MPKDLIRKLYWILYRQDNKLDQLEEKKIMLLIEMLEKMKKYNRTDLFNEYIEKFKLLKETFAIKKISAGEKFFRGRVGRKVLACSIDDCNIEVDVPFYGMDISQPPPLNSHGGRFNKEGEAFLYLSSDITTCVAEIKLEVHQYCSIGEFLCKTSFSCLDLTNCGESIFIEELKNILLQPIHKEIEYKYLITQFLAEIIKNIGFDGIVYESTQSDGLNVVCFYPNNFKFIPYSDKIIKATKITYEINEIEDGYKTYRNYSRIYNQNTDRDDENEKAIEYFLEKDREIFHARLDEICSSEDSREEKEKKLRFLADKYIKEDFYVKEICEASKSLGIEIAPKIFY